MVIEIWKSITPCVNEFSVSLPAQVAMDISGEKKN
jgi:hypothetical protein